MRFLSAPWLGLLEDNAWLRHAGHANAMAQRLAAGLGQIAGARLMFPIESNGVFCELPPAVLAGLRERGWRFYTFIGAGGARFMCGWDTRPESVDALLADRLCCAIQSKGALPLTPDGFIPRAPSRACPVA